MQISGRALLKNAVPGQVYNEVFLKLKEDMSSKKLDSSSVSKVEILYFLTRLEIFNPQHRLFSTELEKFLEDRFDDIANGNFKDLMEEFEKNDIFKDALDVSLIDITISTFTSVCSSGICTVLVTLHRFIAF